MPEEKTVKKHRVRKWLFRTAAALFVLFMLTIPATLILWHWYLPGFLIDRVFPEVRHRLGLDDAALSIRRIGWHGADFERFRLADGTGGVLEIDSVRADYLPALRGGGSYLTISSLTLSGMECAVSIQDGKVEISGFRLRKLLEALDRANQTGAPETADNAPAPVILKKVILRHLELKLDLEGRRLSLPVNAEFSSGDPAWQTITAKIEAVPRGQRLTLDGTFDRKNGKLVLQCSMPHFRLEPLADFTGVPGGTLCGNAALELTVGNADLTGNAVLDLQFTPSEKLIAGAEFSSPVKLSQKLDFSYRSSEALLTAIGTGHADVPEFSLAGKKIIFRKPENPEWKFVLTSGADGVKFQELDLTVKNVAAELSGTRLDFPLCRFNRIGEKFLLSGTGGKLAAQDISFGKISFALPLPLSESLPGTFGADEIRYREYGPGKLEAAFSGTAEKLSLNGTLTAPFFEQTRLGFRGEFYPDGGKNPSFLFDADLPTWIPPEPLKLGTWSPALQGATFTGALTMGAALKLENGKLSSGMQLFLQDGEFLWQESGLEATGILADLRITDLFDRKTPPGQQIKIRKCKAGNLEFSDLNLRFRIESSSMLTLEQAHLNWCGGELFLHPLTLYANQKSWEPVLECESINLAEFLRQTGVAPASTQGEGVLYGKLPLKISRNGIFFKPAYLYSRPGEINSIKIAEPEKIASGIGGGVMQQAQLDFAAEALRDFNYNWVKLRFNTEGEEFVLSLQFDGEPAGPLPFAFDEETGTLKRDPTSQATFQGIQLNINTRIPLNALWNFNRKLQQLQEKK